MASNHIARREVYLLKNLHRNVARNGEMVQFFHLPDPGLGVAIVTIVMRVPVVQGTGAAVMGLGEVLRLGFG